MNRINRPAHSGVAPSSPVASEPSEPSPASGGRGGKDLAVTKWLRLATVVLFVSASVLVLTLAAMWMLSKPVKEAAFVDETRVQAVFLNGGQVYFGKITDLTDDYLRLVDIFYLQVNQQLQPDLANNEANNNAAQNNIALVKLGCELHRPTNEMLINREHVLFWENLQDVDGRNTVPGAIKHYHKEFPHGQQCPPEETAEQPAAGNAAPTAPAATPPAAGQQRR